MQERLGITSKRMSTRSKTWPALLAERHSPWEPSADIYRTKTGWLVKFDLAGVHASDVTVAIQGRRLTVSGVRRDSFVEEGSSHYSMEISYNRFERRLVMPANLEDARVTVAAREGLLLVRIITEGKENV
jgi:HSP20 family protein